MGRDSPVHKIFSPGGELSLNSFNQGNDTVVIYFQFPNFQTFKESLLGSLSHENYELRRRESHLVLVRHIPLDQIRPRCKERQGRK
jgi:hypothetical protein